jgi:hypothetical protein
MQLDDSEQTSKKMKEGFCRRDQSLRVVVVGIILRTRHQSQPYYEG